MRECIFDYFEYKTLLKQSTEFKGRKVRVGITAQLEGKEIPNLGNKRNKQKNWEVDAADWN